MRKSSGFTLIELVVTLLIIAILAVIAVPSYLNQTRKSRRSAVEGAVQQLALLQERFRADCTNYATNFSYACPVGSTPQTFTSLAAVYSSTTYYTVTLPTVGSPATSANSYTIKAVATSTGKQNKDTASGTDCSTLYYTYGSDPNVDADSAHCGSTTVAGSVTQCPAACWAK